MFDIRRVLHDLGARHQHVESVQPVRARHLLQHRLQGGRDVPEGRDLRLDAAGDVGLDDGAEGVPAREGGGLVREVAGAGVAVEEGGGVGEFVVVGGLGVGAEDDLFVFGVAGGEEVVGVAVEGFARFEEPFELRELFQQFRLLVAFHLRGVGGGGGGVGAEAGAEGLEGGGGAGDEGGVEGVYGGDDGGLEEVEGGLGQVLG